MTHSHVCPPPSRSAHTIHRVLGRPSGSHHLMDQQRRPRAVSSAGVAGHAHPTLGSRSVSITHARLQPQHRRWPRHSGHCTTKRSLGPCSRRLWITSKSEHQPEGTELLDSVLRHGESWRLVRRTDILSRTSLPIRSWRPGWVLRQNAPLTTFCEASLMDLPPLRFPGQGEMLGQL
jgi:hypothetical protein